MAGPIEVDLEDAQECNAARMIEFLFAFCLSEGGKKVPKCDDKLLGQAFEAVKEIAKRDGTTLHLQLSKL
jgi:hypothetical protein